MKRFVVALGWGFVFGAIGLLLSMLVYGLLGHLGIQSWPKVTVARIGMYVSIATVVAPFLGFVLALGGMLPGTRD